MNNETSFFFLQVEGYVHVCGVLNVSYPYSAGNPWSQKNSQGVHELDCFPHGAMLLLVLLLLESRR